MLWCERGEENGIVEIPDVFELYVPVPSSPLTNMLWIEEIEENQRGDDEGDEE